jgi:hypothetical protein
MTSASTTCTFAEVGRIARLLIPYIVHTSCVHRDKLIVVSPNIAWHRDMVADALEQFDAFSSDHLLAMAAEQNLLLTSTVLGRRAFPRRGFGYNAAMVLMRDHSLRAQYWFERLVAQQHLYASWIGPPPRLALGSVFLNSLISEYPFIVHELACHMVTQVVRTDYIVQAVRWPQLPHEQPQPEQHDVDAVAAAAADDDELDSGPFAAYSGNAAEEARRQRQQTHDDELISARMPAALDRAWLQPIWTCEHPEELFSTHFLEPSIWPFLNCEFYQVEDAGGDGADEHDGGEQLLAALNGGGHEDYLAF